MAIHSAGNPYGIDENLIFSFPVTCKDGVMAIVPGLDNEFTRAKLELTEKELQEEREQAMSAIVGSN